MQSSHLKGTGSDTSERILLDKSALLYFLTQNMHLMIVNSLFECNQDVAREKI